MTPMLCMVLLSRASVGSGLSQHVFQSDKPTNIQTGMEPGSSSVHLTTWADKKGGEGCEDERRAVNGHSLKSEKLRSPQPHSVSPQLPHRCCPSLAVHSSHESLVVLFLGPEPMTTWRANPSPRSKPLRRLTSFVTHCLQIGRKEQPMQCERTACPPPPSMCVFDSIVPISLLRNPESESHPILSSEIANPQGGAPQMRRSIHTGVRQRKTGSQGQRSYPG
jgi:hypothetical protein